MLSIIETLVRKPTVERYLASRFTLLRDTPPAERSRVRLAEWEALFDSRAWSELGAAALPHYDAWQLCPRLQFLLGVAAAELGDSEASQVYRERMQVLLRILLLTGDGTRQSPYTITYASDAYDLARTVKFQPCEQRLVELGLHTDAPTEVDQAAGEPPLGSNTPQWCDVLLDSQGNELWFDVTEVVFGQPQASGISRQRWQGLGTPAPLPAKGMRQLAATRRATTATPRKKRTY